MDLTGEYEDRYFVTTRGDSRISITISRNDRTKKLSRRNRFLIDDPDLPGSFAYALTKPLKVGHVYNGNGVYIFVLQEVNSTDGDNTIDKVADEYADVPVDNQRPNVDEEKRGVWL